MKPGHSVPRTTFTLSSGRAEAGLLVQLWPQSREHPPGLKCGLLPGPIKGAVTRDLALSEPQPERELGLLLLPWVAGGLAAAVLSPLPQLSSRWLLGSWERGV